MSIASNVILENTRLGATRGKLRNKLTEYNIWWDNSLTIFELVERLMLLFGLTILDIVKSETVTPEGFENFLSMDSSLKKKCIELSEEIDNYFKQLKMFFLYNNIIF